MLFKKYKQYINGRFVEEDELLISPRDLGFTRGYGVFEYMRTYKGRIFKISEHIKRLIDSADTIKLKHNFTHNDIRDILLKQLELNEDGNEKSIRIHLSGGISDSMQQVADPTIVIFMDIFKPKNSDIYKNGVALKTVKYQRDVPSSKNTNYIEGIIQAHKNKDKGILEPLYYSEKQVFETSNSNIFAVKDGKIYTPKTNVFLGTARGVVVNDLKKYFDIKEEDFDLNFLLKSDEVFLASGGKQIAPVVKIDNILIGSGDVGTITSSVFDRYKEFVESDKW